MPAINTFAGSTSDGGTPALKLSTIAPSDSVDLDFCVRMIYAGVGGDIAVTDSEGNTVTHKNVGTGAYLGPFRVARVRATGTTATNLVGYQ